MRAFLFAAIATAGIAVVFDYGLDRLDYFGAKPAAGSAVRLGD